jgi:flap endonuclease-1
MGVKGFGKIINTLASSCIEIKEFKDYRGKKAALDWSSVIHKFCIAMVESENYESVSGDIICHLFACFYKICSMLRYGIMPYPVFDGKPPDIKLETLFERRKVKKEASDKSISNEISQYEKNKLKKKSFTISNKQTKEMKHLLTLMGIQYLEAPEEAEAQCVALNISNKCDNVVTEDWDAVLFGCKKMLKDFSNKTKIVEINGEKLLQSLEMTKEQLIDLASILGNDYCQGIPNIGPMEALRKFKRANCNMMTFLNTIKNERRYSIPLDFINRWEKAKEYYLHAPVVEPYRLNIFWKKPNFNQLYEYLVVEKKFNKKSIYKKINELKLMYQYYSHNKHNLVTFSRIKKELSPKNNILQQNKYRSLGHTKKIYRRKPFKQKLYSKNILAPMRCV